MDPIVARSEERVRNSQEEGSDPRSRMDENSTKMIMKHAPLDRHIICLVLGIQCCSRE